MTISISTLLRTIDFNSQVIDFWDNQLFPRTTKRYDSYSSFKDCKKLPKWDDFISENNVYSLIDKLIYFNRLEKYDFHYNKIDSFDPDNYLSIKMLDILSKNKLNLTEAVKENYITSDQADEGWYKQELFHMYFLYLDMKNEFIPNELAAFFIEKTKEDKRYSTHISIDEEVATFFQLLKVIHPTSITYEFFSENLNLFCLRKNKDSRVLENHCAILNYDSQKKIYDYISDHFPEHIDDNKQYYEPLLPQPIFSFKKLYQGSIDINIFQLVHQFKVQQKDFEHLSGIAQHCLDVVASQPFMDMIHEDIKVSNINKVENQQGITLNFSTNSYSELEKFESILFSALKGVLSESSNIKLQWTENHNDEYEINTNMNADFVYRYYSFHALDAALDSNNNTKRQNKI